jgi:hypothetical protein
MSLYAFPMIGGAGLGNELFPWSRAEVFARRFGARVLAPRWTRLRIGPYFRREPDKRRYAGALYSADHVHGFSRWFIQAACPRIDEGQPESVYVTAKATPLACVVAFRGTGDFFASLLGEHGFVRDRLWSMTAPFLRSPKGEIGVPYIAMHVRRGDLTRQGFSSNTLKQVKQYTPLSWFVAMTRAVRQCRRLRNLPIVVFTDGSHDEVMGLCRLDNVQLRPRRHAMADLWAMSRATLLFASGYSTYGMWASFLGSMPTLYAPGKIQQRVQAGRAGSIELEVHEGDPIPLNVEAGVAELVNSTVAHDGSACRHAARRS